MSTNFSPKAIRLDQKTVDARRQRLEASRRVNAEKARKRAESNARTTRKLLGF